jgi:membrane associated rhomboid family serine protease
MQEPGSTGNMIRQMSAVKMIIILNLCVFLAWQIPTIIPHGNLVFTKTPALQLISIGNLGMQTEFQTSWTHLSTGRIWTLLTAAFSHNDLFHIALNMLVFLSFAPVLEARWGKRRFLYFYLSSAVFSSFLMASMPLLGVRDLPGLGASGAVMAITTSYAIYYPRNVILIWGILPAPAWLIVAAFAFFDLKGLLTQINGGNTGIGHAAHLGGILFGLFVLMIAPRFIDFSSIAHRSSNSSSSVRGQRRRDPADYYPAASPGDRDHREEERLDNLLTKVSREGIDALSDDERDDLHRISRKRRDSS